MTTIDARTRLGRTWLGRTWPGRARTAACAVAAVLLGGFGIWAHEHAAELRGGPSGSNTALTDSARTSEVKGEVAQAVDTVFSYDYAHMDTTDAAARKLLTGQAVKQYQALFTTVRKQAPAQRLVLTTTVTDAAVHDLTADRARLLLFADQRSTRTTDGVSSYAAAMLAVDAVRVHGHWLIATIDTFSS